MPNDMPFDLPDCKGDEQEAHRPGRQNTGKIWFATCEDIFDHEVVGPDVKAPPPADQKRHAWQPMIVWQWLIKEAARLDRTRILQGREVPLKRGQIAVSQRYLAIKANWGRKAIRGFFERLERFHMVRCSAEEGPGITIVTICNYDKYQTPPRARGPRGAHEGPTRGPKQYRDTQVHIEEQDRARTREEDASATIIKLDEHRFPVSESQFHRYHALVNGWGVARNAIRLGTPYDRSLTDRNMLDCLALHRDKDAQVVLRAVDMTLITMEAKRHEEHKAGREGMSSCSKFFSKTVETNIGEVLLSAAKLAAKARTAEMAEQAALKRRMDGINGKRNGGSWEDLGAEVFGQEA